MGGMRPGPTCISFGDWVDPGTTCLNVSPVPIVVGIAEVVVRETRDAIAAKLHSMRNDVGAALDYIQTLPEQTRREAAYEFFASFFDHYLPKKFLHQYVWGHGRPLELTEQEMIDCNPYITVMRCKAFQNTLKSLEGSSGSELSLDMTCPAGALTNGTLGQFSVPMHVALTYRSQDDWELAGTMSFYDQWDFDPKDFSTGGRSTQGELKTRFANYTLPGDGFKITSVEVPFTQTASDPTIVWKGGAPVAVPDKAAKLDIELQGID